MALLLPSFKLEATSQRAWHLRLALLPLPGAVLASMHICSTGLTPLVQVSFTLFACCPRGSKPGLLPGMGAPVMTPKGMGLSGFSFLYLEVVGRQACCQ